MNLLSNNTKLHPGDIVTIIDYDKNFTETKKYIGVTIEIETFYCRSDREYKTEWYILKGNNWAWRLDWLEYTPTININIDQDNILEMFGE